MATSVVDGRTFGRGVFRPSIALRVGFWLSVIGISASVGCAAETEIDEALDNSDVGLLNQQLSPLSNETDFLALADDPDTAPVMQCGAVNCRYDENSTPFSENFVNERRVRFKQTVTCSGPVDFVDLAVELEFFSVEVPAAEQPRTLGGDRKRGPAPQTADTGPLRCPPTRGLGGFRGFTSITVQFKECEPKTITLTRVRSPQHIDGCGMATGLPPQPPPPPPVDPDAPSAAEDIAVRCDLVTVDECQRFAAQAGVELIVVRVPTMRAPSGFIFETRVVSINPPRVEVRVAEPPAPSNAPPTPPTNVTVSAGWVTINFDESPSATRYVIRNSRGEVVRETTSSSESLPRLPCEGLIVTVEACNQIGCSPPVRERLPEPEPEYCRRAPPRR